MKNKINIKDLRIRHNKLLQYKLNLLAKGNGITLLEHSIIVCEFAVYLAIKSNLDDDLIIDIYYSALFHDIGKCVEFIQKYLNKIKDKEAIEDEYDTNFPHHQEISWSFLANIINNDKYSIILNTVYYHHAKLIKDKNYNNSIDILNCLSEEDKKTLEEVFNLLSDNEFTKSSLISSNIPDYNSTANNNLVDSINQKNTICRSCLMSADRTISSLSLDEFNNILNSDNRELEYEKLYNKTNIRGILEYTLTDEFKNSRYDEQEYYAKKAREYHTNIFQAPAGHGKTLFGLIWFLLSNRNLIWSCSKNDVAKNVYKTLVEYAKKFKINISIELFYENKRQKSYNAPDGEFNSNIIVTNVYNTIYPLVSNSVASRAYNITSTDIIFDEFHELVTDESLFYGFVLLMQIRNQITKANTLLLSATPGLLSTFWDSDEYKTRYLPSKDKYCTPVHDGKYNLKILNEIPADVPNDSCIIFNSIGNSQIYHKLVKNILLYHSKFMEIHKIFNLDRLFELFGKENVNKHNKKNVTATTAITSSIDVSFNHIFIVLSSIEILVQAIGRCVRWVSALKNLIERGITPTINIILHDKSDKSESASINVIYDLELNNIFRDYLLKKYPNENNFVTLKEIYEMYIEFNNKYKNEILNYLYDKLKKSRDNFSKMVPVKYILNGNKKNKSRQKSCVTLLSSSTDIQFIVKDLDTGKWITHPFSERLDHFKQIPVYDLRNVESYPGGQKKLEKILKEITKEDNDFNYERLLNAKTHGNKIITLQKLFDSALYMNTPFPDITREYSKELGLHKK